MIKIGELSRRSGVPVSTLRTWERRYGFPRAERSAGGQRRYPESEVQRVLEARRVVEAGWPIRLAVRRSDEPDPAQRSAAALEVTADLGVRALSGTPFRPLGRDAVSRLRRLYDADAALLMSLERGHLVTEAADPPGGVVTRLVATPSTAAGYVAGTRTALLIENRAEEHRFERYAVRNDEGTGSAVLAPLVKKGACLGIIALYRNDPYSLHADALGAVQCVANVLAAAETTPGTRGT